MGFVKDGPYYFQPSRTLVPSTLHSTNSPYQWYCHLRHPLLVNLKHLVPSFPHFSSVVKINNLRKIKEEREEIKHTNKEHKNLRDSPICLHPWAAIEKKLH